MKLHAAASKCCNKMVGLWCQEQEQKYKLCDSSEWSDQHKGCKINGRSAWANNSPLGQSHRQRRATVAAAAAAAAAHHVTELPMAAQMLLSLPLLHDTMCANRCCLTIHMDSDAPLSLLLPIKPLKLPTAPTLLLPSLPPPLLLLLLLLLPNGPSLLAASLPCPACCCWWRCMAV